MPPLRGRALLFGLNYASHSNPKLKLNGCINDVKKMAEYLKTKFNIPVDVYTDEVPELPELPEGEEAPEPTPSTDCTGYGIISHLYEMAMLSWKEQLNFVWIHYSGHGASIADTNRDEKDGKDECLVPIDYDTSGMITDDYVNTLFSYFNPNTRVVCVFDCCHSGTIGDVKYSWDVPTRPVLENVNCKAKAKIITISGCLDRQTSADAFNLLSDGEYIGALTACFLLTLQEKPRIVNDVFGLVNDIRQKLKQRKFSQYPKLCSTYNLSKDKVLIPQ